MLIGLLQRLSKRWIESIPKDKTQNIELKNAILTNNSVCKIILFYLFLSETKHMY